MTTKLEVVSFDPKSIASGDKVQVKFEYSSPRDSFIVVNESPEFDARPGKIPIKKGTDRRKTASITIERQPGAKTKDCLITFTLSPANIGQDRRAS